MGIFIVIWRLQLGRKQASHSGGELPHMAIGTSLLFAVRSATIAREEAFDPIGEVLHETLDTLKRQDGARITSQAVKSEWWRVCRGLTGRL